MGNAEAIPHAAGESVEAIRRRSDEVEQPRAGCVDARPPASTKVINTPHEELFHVALIRAGLSFETQSHPAGDRFEADIELRQAPIVIEVTNSPGEKRAADRRERKTKALEAAGYRVYWFSNHQARTDADGCVRRVMRENGLHREANPAVLIRKNRTGHTRELNPNWGGGPATIACEQCGKPVTAGKRNGGKRARFCNSKCYGEWMHEHPGSVHWRRLDRDWGQLAELHASGMTRKQLAAHYGCSETAIRNEMTRQGIKPRQQGGYRPRAPGS